MILGLRYWGQYLVNFLATHFRVIMKPTINKEAFQLPDKDIKDQVKAKEYMDKFGAFQNKKPPEIVYDLCGGREKYIDFKEEIQKHVLKIKKEFPKMKPNYKLSEALEEEDDDVKSRIAKVKLEEMPMGDI